MFAYILYCCYLHQRDWVGFQYDSYLWIASMSLPIMQYKYIDVYNLQFDFVKADYLKKYISSS